ncbi:hypothetical protein CDL12_06095 [Handroanthus impetiginosus]|uniref:PB1 domain-containing protein n=1 Tax=Handroanthus impetiginosus TaxID=429701 RepID=A0A2G9HUK1_9LAMI|nr:hypothetical protein CDL12_06095 [Handroanthus impetiginosus]
MNQKVNSSNNRMETIKFLYSYGGRIIPRPTDGKLRYVGGYTRVLAVDRSITCSELLLKFGDSCGCSMNLKCQLPNEDLDVLVSVKSDEDLWNVIEEYERATPGAKIRAVLFPIKSEKKVSPPSSPMSCFDFPCAPKPPRVKAPSAAYYYAAQPCAAVHRCLYPAVGYPVSAGRYRCYETRSPVPFNPVPRRNHSR